MSFENNDHPIYVSYYEAKLQIVHELEGGIMKFRLDGTKINGKNST